MKKTAAFFLKLIGFGLNAAMMIHIILQWMQGAAWPKLLALFVIYFIPMMGVMKLRERILYPPAKKPSERRQKGRQAATVPQTAAPMPEAPQRPPERRIANPPTIGQAQPALAPQSASMTPELRRFVVEGEEQIQENN